MEIRGFIEVNCDGHLITVNIATISAVTPGTMPQPRRGDATYGEDTTILHLVSGRDYVVDHAVEEVLRLIADELKPETEV